MITRVTCSLDPQTIELLGLLKATTGAPVSEHIRRAVALYAKSVLPAAQRVQSALEA